MTSFSEVFNFLFDCGQAIVGKCQQACSAISSYAKVLKMKARCKYATFMVWMFPPKRKRTKPTNEEIVAAFKPFGATKAEYIGDGRQAWVYKVDYADGRVLVQKMAKDSRKQIELNIYKLQLYRAEA